MHVLWSILNYVFVVKLPPLVSFFMRRHSRLEGRQPHLESQRFNLKDLRVFFREKQWFRSRNFGINYNLYLARKRLSSCGVFHRLVNLSWKILSDSKGCWFVRIDCFVFVHSYENFQFSLSTSVFDKLIETLSFLLHNLHEFACCVPPNVIESSTWLSNWKLSHCEILKTAITNAINVKIKDKEAKKLQLPHFHRFILNVVCGSANLRVFRLEFINNYY